MKLKEPKNKNYCATVVEIKTIIPLEGCNNVSAAIIMGNQVVVGNDTKVGDIGLFFPVETKLSSEYLCANNLYRNPVMNLDSTKKGYFEENSRIRCVKFRGHKSEGLFMPMESIDNLFFTSVVIDIDFKVGDIFDEVQEIPVCEKYIPKNTRQPRMSGNMPKLTKKQKESKLIEGQFRFHNDTSQLYNNLHRIKPNSLIHISYKVHGTSGISSKLLCKKPLKWYEKILKKIGINIVDTQYDYIYSSRKAIKNLHLDDKVDHYYSEDIWGITHNELKDYLQDGMTIYYEIVGYLSNGGAIQKSYDYGCLPGDHKIMVYRITYTNPEGKVFEFSAKQVQDWCNSKGLTPVYELFYGKADSLFDFDSYKIATKILNQNYDWNNAFLDVIKKQFNEHNCFMCSNKVPEEGCVIRVEDGMEFEAYKCKSVAFYERETKELDKGEINIEDAN